MNRHKIATLARTTTEEADKLTAIALKDAAPHVLKALGLEIQGYKTSTLDSIGGALSPLVVLFIGWVLWVEEDDDGGKTAYEETLTVELNSVMA